MGDAGLTDSNDAPVDLAGQVREQTIADLPQGYTYGVSRYADIILREAFPARLAELVQSLSDFRPSLDELRAGGGGRTAFVRRFDESLAAQTHGDETIWGKQVVTIEKALSFGHNMEQIDRVRSHEIDMFGVGKIGEPFPGIAVEMEWNNKDPFYDRDLLNFQALHHEGAIAVGVIVTRGPRLQELVAGLIRSKDGGFKYGQSSTHWSKLVPRVNLGGGGECPLLLVGIEPERIDGISLVYEARKRMDDADRLKEAWRDTYDRWADAKPVYERLRREALELLPPLADTG